jgi:hypothetical protein
MLFAGICERGDEMLDVLRQRHLLRSRPAISLLVIPATCPMFSLGYCYLLYDCLR